MDYGTPEESQQGQAKSLGLLSSYAQKYPQTVSKEVLGKLNHPNPQVRINFCRILKTAGSMEKEVVEALLKTLSDTNQRVRYEASQALSRITGQSISFPEPTDVPQSTLSEREKDSLKQWAKWWKEHQEKIKKAQEEQKKKEELEKVLQKIQKIQKFEER